MKTREFLYKNELPNDTIKVTKKNEVISTLKVWLGQKNKVNVVVEDSIYLTVPKRKKKIISRKQRKGNVFIIKKVYQQLFFYISKTINGGRI